MLCSNSRLVLTAVSVLAGFLAATAPGQPVPNAKHLSVAASYGKLPLSFEANRGQTDSHVRFLSRGGGYSLFLTDSEAVLELHKGEPANSAQVKMSVAGRLGRTPAPGLKTDVVRMQLDGASRSLRVTGNEELPGTANYFIGNDPTKWHSAVPTYARVRYEGVYPGVDLVYYGNQGQLEYDFVVAPNADPKPIRLLFAGAKRLRLNRAGDLEIVGQDGEIAFHKPVVYQEVDGKRQPVRGSFTLLGKNKAGFAFGKYDKARALVIDPTLVYSTFLGGGGNNGKVIAVDTAGAAYIAGVASTADFPVTSGAVQPTDNGAATDVTNVFAAKLNADGSAVVYSTYLGGSGSGQANYGDEPFSIAVDAVGDVYLAGDAYSTNFPVTAAALQTVNKGASKGVPNGFLTKLNSTGTALIYSTYLGGTGITGFTGPGGPNSTLTGGDQCIGLAIDASGNAYLTGVSYSADFPVTSSALQSVNNGAATGLPTAFVAKVAPAGDSLVYATYLGGSGGDGAAGIAIDASGDAYVGGATGSTDFPLSANPLQGTNKGAVSGFTTAFISELNPSGSSLLYSTYLGGSGNTSGIAQGDNLGDSIYVVAIDSSKNIYVSGPTFSADFPVTSGAPQSTNKAYASDSLNLFAAKLNPSGTALVYSTYLGSSVATTSLGSGSMAVDALGNMYLTGFELGTDFPVTADAFQSANNCAAHNLTNAFFTEINATGTSFLYSTYLGGSGYPTIVTDLGTPLTFYTCDIGYGLALDGNGSAYLTGDGASIDFPITKGVYKSTKSGPHSAFVAKFGPGSRMPPIGTLEQAIDDATGSTTISQADQLFVSGWSADPSLVTTLSNVQILIDGSAVGVPLTGLSRPDVAAYLGDNGYTSSGYSLTYSAATMSPGTHQVTAVVTDSGGYSTTFGPIGITVTASVTAAPIGNFELAVDNVTATATISQGDSLYVSGWALSPKDGSSPKSVTVSVDGASIGPATTGMARSDVASFYNNSAYSNSGYAFTYVASQLSTGTHSVTVVATDSSGASTTFGPKTITVTAQPPVGNLELAVDESTASILVQQGDPLFVSGWAADYHDNGPAQSVQVLIDGVAVGTATLGISRPDVEAAYPAQNWSTTGWFSVSGTSSLGIGEHSATAIATDSLGLKTTLGPTLFVVY